MKEEKKIPNWTKINIVPNTSKYPNYHALKLLVATLAEVYSIKISSQSALNLTRYPPYWITILPTHLPHTTEAYWISSYQAYN